METEKYLSKRSLEGDMGKSTDCEKRSERNRKDRRNSYGDKREDVYPVDEDYGVGGARKNKDYNLSKKTGRDVDERLNLEKKVGETTEDYHIRLFAIRSSQVGLIAAYEEEKRLDRYRSTDDIAKNLLEGGNIEDEEEMKKVLVTLQTEVREYIDSYPNFSERKKVRKKLRDLDSLF